MITSHTIFDYLRAQPIRPFRIHMASGKSFDIRHPEMMKVGKTNVIVFTILGGEPEIYDHWDTVSLMLIENISFLDVAAAKT